VKVCFVLRPREVPQRVLLVLRVAPCRLFKIGVLDVRLPLPRSEMMDDLGLVRPPSARSYGTCSNELLEPTQVRLLCCGSLAGRLVVVG
jgi:hypothetical protein